MASPALCYYCFESLSASFDDREPINLATVEALWEQHEQSKKLSTLGSQANKSGESDADEGDVNDDSHKSLKPPGVRRLQSQTSSSDSSSIATTPSSASNTSSNSLLSSSTAAPTPLGSQTKTTEQKYPLFVTWNTLSRSGHKSLRGCIGTFEAQDLPTGLNQFSLTSAFDDTRFSPIPKSLIPSLSCSLTLLGSFEPCTNAMDWILGTHGLRISFIYRGRRHGATYLPDVPIEQGWTKEETVESLMRKAGWDGGAGNMARRLLRTGASDAGATKPWNQVSEFRTVRYQGHGASASYADWQEWRNWVLSLEDSANLLGSTLS